MKHAAVITLLNFLQVACRQPPQPPQPQSFKGVKLQVLEIKRMKQVQGMKAPAAGNEWLFVTCGANDVMAFTGSDLELQRATLYDAIGAATEHAGARFTLDSTDKKVADTLFLYPFEVPQGKTFTRFAIGGLSFDLGGVPER